MAQRQGSTAVADAPDTLPSDFFEKKRSSGEAPDTLPGDFFDTKEAPGVEPTEKELPGSTPRLRKAVAAGKAPSIPRTEQEEKTTGEGISLKGVGGGIWDTLTGMASQGVRSLPYSAIPPLMPLAGVLPGESIGSQVGREAAHEYERSRKAGSVPAAAAGSAAVAGAGPLFGQSNIRQEELAERGEGGRILGEAAVPTALALAGPVAEVAGPPTARALGRVPGIQKLNVARTGWAEKLVSPSVYENVGETAADRRLGIKPESGIVGEGHFGTKKGILEAAQKRTAVLKQAADNILQNHPNANVQINVEPMIDTAIDEAISKSEKVAGSTERLENLRLALKTKYGPTTGTPFEINNLKTDIQKAASDLGAYKNTQPVEASIAAAMKNVAKRIKDEVNHQVPEVKDFNERMSNSIDAQAGLQRHIDKAKGETIFGGFHEGTIPSLLNKSVGSTPVRSTLAQILNIGNVKDVPFPGPTPPPPIPAIPPVAPRVVPPRGGAPGPAAPGPGPIQGQWIPPAPGPMPPPRANAPFPQLTEFAGRAPTAPPPVPAGPERFGLEPIGTPTDPLRLGMRGEQGVRIPPIKALPEAATAVPATEGLPFKGPEAPKTWVEKLAEAPKAEQKVPRETLEQEISESSRKRAGKTNVPVEKRYTQDEILAAEGLLNQESGAMLSGERPGIKVAENEMGEYNPQRSQGRGTGVFAGGHIQGVKSARGLHPFMEANPDVNPAAVQKALRNKDSAAYSKLIDRAVKFNRGESETGLGAADVMDFIRALDEQKAEKAAAAPAAETPKGQTGIIPGMEQDVARQQEGAAKVAGEKLTGEINTPKDISAAAGRMETLSPLFRGTEASPQREIFGGKIPKIGEGPKVPPAIEPVLDETGWEYKGVNNLGMHTIQEPGTNVRITLFDRELQPDFVRRKIAEKEKQYGTPKKGKGKPKEGGEEIPF